MFLAKEGHFKTWLKKPIIINFKFVIFMHRVQWVCGLEIRQIESKFGLSI